MMDAAADSLSEGFLLVRVGMLCATSVTSLTSFISGGTRDQTFKTERRGSSRENKLTNMNYGPGRPSPPAPAKLSQLQVQVAGRGGPGPAEARSGASASDSDLPYAAGVQRLQIFLFGKFAR